MPPTLSGLAETLPGRLLTSEADLAAYSYDGALDRGRPDGVILARSADDVRATVAWCASNGVPFIARGAGTNLCGGCVPTRGGVVLSTARMDRILAVDTGEGTALIEPGVVNLRLQRELDKVGRFYAPDPASYKVCTIGGNVGENAGGPRCLKYGVTTNHVRGVEAVLPDGSVERFFITDPGPELVSLLVGAEGTLGLVSKVWVDTLPIPESIAAVLAAFPSLDAATSCVAALIAAGIVPRVLEAMDRLTVDSIEAYAPAGYPRAEAVLLIEVEGPPRRVDLDLARVEELCRAHGASELRRALDPSERDRLWEGRRSAYAALARLAPNVLVEDGVVPRSRLPEAAKRVAAIAAGHGVRAGLLFHAGDGNLHPNIIFDERDRELTARVKAAGREILQTCVALGGSLSGEHGIGIDKRAAMSWLFSPQTLALFRRIKEAFDPDGLSNPDKVLPLAHEGPGEFRRPPSPPLSDAAAALVERVREKAARKEEVAVVGSGSRSPEGLRRRVPELLSVRPLSRVLDVDRANYTVTAEAGVALRELKAQLEPEGLYVPVPLVPGTLGGLLATKPWPGLREHLLGMRVLLADGSVCELGAKVVKNVAGYDVPRLLLGSWGTLAVILEVTLRLLPVRPEIPSDLPRASPFVPNRWHRLLKSAFDPEGRLNAWVWEAP